MVDAFTHFESRPRSKARPARNGSDVHVTVAAATGSALAGYRALSLAGAVCAPRRASAGSSTGSPARKPDPIIAILTEDGEAVMALALEVVRKGPFRVARFMSGTHANGNFALSRPSWLPQATCDEVRAVVAAIAKARPDVDMIALERLLPDARRGRQPAAALPHFAEPQPVARLRSRRRLRRAAGALERQAQAQEVPLADRASSRRPAVTGASRPRRPPR